jgi:hypothetical protein
VLNPTPKTRIVAPNEQKNKNSKKPCIKKMNNFLSQYQQNS